ncbi:MAG: protein of unknown function (DUF4330) [Phormidesmis priestleyi Ana]|uniref:Pyruvate/2-oxoglutarate dehydrogenase complex,dihydrolipoamide dehydrogenase (E3) component n=1 Tax=Phormidesmis priestleyi Ana TaxID=1666911 RepID=A0A0P7YUN9_9CYAN|nr:MAG: protein of unknown function (DUF4330) [Phormidesmis priestleyi Ana]
MAILDSKGRLFGKLSLLDLGAALAIFMVVFGIFFYPGATGSIAQSNVTKQAVEVDVIARGLTVLNPEQFLADLATTTETKIIVRNQPYGDPVQIKKVLALPRSVAVPQPDGSVKSYPDPRPELGYTADMLITLGSEAQVVDGSPILGVPVKIGTPVEIEGKSYNFKVSTVAIRLLDDAAAPTAAPAPEPIAEPATPAE